MNKKFDIINDSENIEEIYAEEKKLLIKWQYKLNNALRSLKTKGNIFNNLIIMFTVG